MTPTMTVGLFSMLVLLIPSTRLLQYVFYFTRMSSITETYSADEL